MQNKRSYLFHRLCSVVFVSVAECSALHPCEGLSKHAHFQNFGMAFLTLFRVATGDNWNGIMKVMHVACDWCRSRLCLSRTCNSTNDIVVDLQCHVIEHSPLSVRKDTRPAKNIAVQTARLVHVKLKIIRQTIACLCSSVVVKTLTVTECEIQFTLKTVKTTVSLWMYVRMLSKLLL